MNEIAMRFGQVFWGLFLVILDLSVNRFDLLPDFIGSRRNSPREAPKRHNLSSAHDHDLTNVNMSATFAKDRQDCRVRRFADRISLADGKDRS